MNNFYNGFGKVAAILSKLDSQGGLAPRSPEEMAAAQGVDLLTLPKNAEGASCKNCRFYKVLDKQSGMGMCQNPNVMLEVTDRMHCNQWDGMGALRNYEAVDAANVEPQGMPAEIGEDGMPIEEQPLEAAPAEQAQPEKKEKKPTEKKDSKGHEININVGGKTMDKKAFMDGFDKQASIAGGMGRAIGAIKGTATKAGKGVQQYGRQRGLEFRLGKAKGIAETNPALARSIRMKTNPTKAPAAPSGGVKEHLRNAAIAGTAVAGGLGAGMYLGSKGEQNAS